MIFLMDKATNEEIITCLKDISNNINKLIDVMQKSNISEEMQINNTKIEELSKDISKVSKKIKSKSQKNKAKENTLIISYSEKKVVLPYTNKEIKKILINNKNKYSNKKDVVQSLYTIPLSYYRFASISRFREAFKLIRQREHGSLKEAFDLAFEVYANYNIHPAIITACKTLHEFDIYLSCLEYNELEDFKFFKIKFIAPPAVVKPKSEDLLAT